MTDNKKQSNPILVILCALGVVAFLLFVIYPNYTRLQEFDRQIASLTDDITVRQSLAPVFKTLVQKARIEPSNLLIAPAPSTLDRNDTGRLTTLFQDIAASANMRLISITPDSQVYERASGRLLVDVVFIGSYSDIQVLINRIAAKAFVEEIHGIDIRCAENEKRIDLSIALFYG